MIEFSFFQNRSKQKELDDIYDVLHTKLDQFTIHSIYSNIYMKQLNSILERLCIIREEIIKPITIDLINKNSNNIVSLINSHDVSYYYSLIINFNCSLKVNVN